MSDEDKIYKKKCPYCERILSSLSEQQLAYNSQQHIEACKNKFLKNYKGGKDGIRK